MSTNPPSSAPNLSREAWTGTVSTSMLRTVPSIKTRMRYAPAIRSMARWRQILQLRWLRKGVLHRSNPWGDIGGDGVAEDEMGEILTCGSARFLSSYKIISTHI